jgi:hypothetical protein
VSRKSRLQIDAGSIEGIDEALKVLGEIEDAVRKDMPKYVQKIASGVGAEIVAAFPGEVDGMDLRNRRIVHYRVIPSSKVDTSDRPVKSVGDPARQVPIFRIVVTGQNATFADLGQEHIQEVQPRVSAVRQMNARYGGISRFAWPVFERRKRDAEAATIKALEALADRLTKALKFRKAGG